ncbi:PTS sugar transporter subunit IIB [Gracilibacillus alcaliphilus]|uniref:hypothetical protein n=1 Tax=Gracilibacillus alcaliphilus TaxID=1401441 RepID=UPI00195CBA33|nr:hypothetical protein [Gracilibacillus alcaliphilus]MBM7676236.1 PTS system galactitol-specific IIB component [Gracilibacillus alcaliphilus]
MAKVLVATGTSQNKMNKVVDILQSGLAAKGVTAEIVAENIYETNVEEVNPDVIVLVGVNKLETDIPTIDGVPFITGVGTDGVIDQVIAHIS